MLGMDPSPPFRLLQAVRRAHPLPAWSIDPDGLPLHVSSVFRSVLDIAGPGGLLAIADDTVGGLPDGVSVIAGDLRLLGVRPGMRVIVSPTVWTIPDARVQVELGAARPWSPFLATVRSRGWPERRQTVASRLEATLAGGSLLSGLVDHIADATTADLAEAIHRRDRAAAAAAARRLIGLGAGLTPAGDDIITGAEAALHAVGHPLAGFTGAALADVEVRTTEVAAAMLRHAARGAFAERIHRLIRATLVDDPDPAGDPLRGAADWGATSGMDTLAGIVLALDAAAGRAVYRRAA